MHDRIRVLIAKPGLDGRDRGAGVTGTGLRETPQTTGGAGPKVSE